MRIPALYMRGGTSKGVFFRAADLPTDAARRDALLLRLMGSPDPYGQQIDGLGGGTSSTSKVVLLARSRQPGHELDYRFGAVSIGQALIDWSGSCGNLAAAVAPAALALGLLTVADGAVSVPIWQVNLGKTLLAHLQVKDGRALESGEFMLDGVPFCGAEIRLDFMDAGGGEGGGRLLPTGCVVDHLRVDGLGIIEATLIDAGNPLAIVAASALGLDGSETRARVNADTALLERVERWRAAAAVAMGLVPTAAAATRDRPATPRLAYVAAPRGYVASSGRRVAPQEVDLVARVFSMGQLHHAIPGTGAVALAAAAAVPGTVVNRLLGCSNGPVRLGHTAGITTVCAEAAASATGWRIGRVSLGRSARLLMEGWVQVPEQCEPGSLNSSTPCIHDSPQ